MQPETDVVFMRRCLQLATEAKKVGKTAVGSIVVKNNVVIAEGFEGDSSLPQLLAHAEVVAIIRAVQKLGTNDLHSCVLYTTVEPCYMCSYIIREVKISRVIFGVNAGDVGGATASYPLLQATHIKKWRPVLVEGGILETACLELLQGTKTAKDQ
jgi:tRNA(adenine34) deaminase